jgi:hypothetical protein
MVPGATFYGALRTQRQSMWILCGSSFGYRRAASPFTHDGREVGRFRGNKVYGVDRRMRAGHSSAISSVRCSGRVTWRWGRPSVKLRIECSTTWPDLNDVDVHDSLNLDFCPLQAVDLSSVSETNAVALT